MSVFSPTAQGFRLILRRPSIPLAEIGWRWSFAAASWFLLAALFTEYADTLPVNTVERLLLGTRQPALIVRALQRIFHGSALRFTESGILLAIAMAGAWTVIASFGRLPILQTMAEEFELPRVNRSRGLFASLAGLNLLRVAVSLAALVAGLGAFLLPNGIWASTHASATGILRAGSALLACVWAVWAILNWLLSTAGLFVVTEGLNSFSALVRTVGWYRENLGSVVAVGIWFGLAHLGALIVAFGAGFTVLGQAGILGTGPTLILELLIVCIYAAVADFLHTGRFAAYLWIAGGKDVALAAPTRPSAPTPLDSSAAVDQTEVILSDVPFLPAT